MKQLLLLCIITFLSTSAYCELKFELDKDGQCVSVLTSMLESERDKATKAMKVCDNKEEKIRKEMFGASVKKKAKLRKKIKKASKCSCNVEKVSIKKKIEILEMALKKLKEKQANYKCNKVKR